MRLRPDNTNILAALMTMFMLFWMMVCSRIGYQYLFAFHVGLFIAIVFEWKRR